MSYVAGTWNRGGKGTWEERVRLNATRRKVLLAFVSDHWLSDVRMPRRTMAGPRCAEMVRNSETKRTWQLARFSLETRSFLEHGNVPTLYFAQFFQIHHISVHTKARTTRAPDPTPGPIRPDGHLNGATK